MCTINSRDVINSRPAGWWIVAKITELERIVRNNSQPLATWSNSPAVGRMWLAIWRSIILAMAHMQSQQTCVLVHTSYRHDPWLRRFYRGPVQESCRGGMTRTLVSNCRSILRVAFSAPQPGNALFPNSSIGGFGKAWISALAGIRLVGWARDVHTPLHGESSVAGSFSDWGFDWKNIKFYNGSVDLRLTKCNVISN
jgi:hypothetical protein